MYVCMYVCTAQTFNSCTSRPYVCQCLVVHTPMDNMSDTHAKHINALRSSVVRLSMPGLPRQLVKELNVGTV